MPDRITFVDTYTGIPIQTGDLAEKVRAAFNLLVLPSNPMISTPETLKVWVPKSFGYNVPYQPIGTCIPHDPVPPAG